MCQKRANREKDIPRRQVTVASSMPPCAVDRVPNCSTRVTRCDEILQRKDTQILNYVYQVFNICFFLKTFSNDGEVNSENLHRRVTVRVHLVLA